MWQRIISLLCVFGLSPAMAITPETELHVIIKYKQQHFSTSHLKSQLQSTLPLTIKTLTPMAGSAYTMVLDGHSASYAEKFNDPNGVMESLLTRLRKDPNIQYAVEDRKGFVKPLPAMIDDDAVHSEVGKEIDILSHDLQWDQFSPPAGIMLESAAGLMDGAWSMTNGQALMPVVVAVLDTGIALHDSLVNNLIKDEWGQIWGWNFSGNNRNISDEMQSYHGTHVAGTIAAYGKVIKGVGEQLKILPVKIPDASGMFYESQVINAIYWSVGGEVPGVPLNPYPASVLNMSFGVDEKPGKEVDHCDEALQEAMSFARRHNAVILVAAGNDNRWEHYNAPAVCNHAVKVASVGPEGLRAYYSNYGSSVSFAAPGGDTHYGKQGGILSTVVPGGGYQSSGYDFYQGTSMATPHAAGVAGLMYAVSNHDITPERVEQLLYATTHAFGVSDDVNRSCIGEKPCGHGILDANQAVKAAMAHYDVIFSVSFRRGLLLQTTKSTSFKGQPSNVVQWQKRHGGSQLTPIDQQQRGRVRVADDGAIEVYSGTSVYVLNQQPFRYCDVIGVDGIGCYLK